jgi:hypothetical protein
MSHTLRLHEEILDFCACMSPRPEEEQQRAELIRAISKGQGMAIDIPA